MGDKVQFASPRHLLLHFDLDTTDGSDRSGTYKAIDAIKNPPPRRLTGSVYIISIPNDVSPLDFAFEFWKILATATKGTLRTEDAFFLHVGAGQAGHTDVLFQCPANAQLDLTPDVSVLESLFIK